MRVIQSERKRPLDLLTIGVGGQVAAACSVYGVQGDVEVWDTASGTLLFTQVVGEREVKCLAFTPDGKYLFIGGESEITVFEPNSWKGIIGPDLPGGGYPEFVFSAAGNAFLVTGSGNAGGGQVICWEMDDGWPHRPLWVEGPDPPHRFHSSAISPNGERVALSSRAVGGDRVRQAIQFRDTQTGKMLTEIVVDAADPILQLAFTVDGSRLLARSSGRTVKVFDAATGQPAGELVHPGRQYVTGMAVHPGGLVACSRNNGRVCFWDVAKRELVRSLDWKLGKLVSVAFSPDAHIGAAGTEDGQVIVWDVDV